jgi:hypothetical protein
MIRITLLLLGCDAAHAHGYLTKPRQRPPLWAEPGMQGHTSASATYRSAEPVFTLNGPITSNAHPYRADSYSCHDFKAETPQTTITAGESLDLVWEFEANHPGDWCASAALCLTSPLPCLTSSDPHVTSPQLLVHLLRGRQRTLELDQARRLPGLHRSGQGRNLRWESPGPVQRMDAYLARVAARLRARSATLGVDGRAAGE